MPKKNRPLRNASVDGGWHKTLPMAAAFAQLWLQADEGYEKRLVDSEDGAKVGLYRVRES